MPRPLLAWLLLLNYLLVVGAGLRIERPGMAAPSAAHPYVHSATCQQQHYLLVDCFDTCNDDNQSAFAFTIKVSGEHGSHVQAQTKSLEVHFGTWQPQAVASEWVDHPLPGRWLVPASPAIAAGFGPSHYPPPQRG